MNRAWRRRRTKRGAAARQFASCQRQLRRLRAAKAPMPWIATSRGIGLVLTITIATPQTEDQSVVGYWEDELEDWEPAPTGCP